MNEWLLIGNSNYIDIKKTFDGLNSITWPQLNGCAIGDVVYVYATKPYQAILYSCRIEEINLHRMDREVVSHILSPMFYENSQTYMRLKKLQSYPENMFTDDELRKNGLNNLQNSAKVSQNISDYIAQKSGQYDKYNTTLTSIEAFSGCEKIVQLKDGRKINVTCPAGLGDGQLIRLKIDGKLTYIQVCVSDAANEAKKDTDNSVGKSEIGKGILGAILGGLLSSAVWIVMYKLGFIGSIAGFISAVLIFKGYEILGKSLDKKGIITSIFIMILMIYLSVFLAMSIDVLTVNDYPLTISNIQTVFCNLNIYMFGTDELASSILYNVALAYIFSAMGSFAFIKRSAKKGRVVSGE